MSDCMPQMSQLGLLTYMILPITFNLLYCDVCTRFITVNTGLWIKMRSDNNTRGSEDMRQCMPQTSQLQLLTFMISSIILSLLYCNIRTGSIVVMTGLCVYYTWFCIWRVSCDENCASALVSCGDFQGHCTGK